MKHIKFIHLRTRHTLILSLLGLCIILYFSKALFGWFTKTEIPSSLPIPVETVEVKEQTMQQSIQTLGSLSGIQEAKLKATSQGRVQSLLVKPGSWVEGGTLLINMTGGPDIRAPFSGYLTDFQVKVGELVVSGTELIDIVDTKKMILNYRVPEHFNNQLKIGQRVDVKVSAHQNKLFQGEVTYLSPVIDKKTFTIQVKAELNNPDQLLKPGMSAHVSHILSIKENALVLPESCLMPTLEGYDVLLIRQGKIQRQAVSIGARKLGRVEILSGLQSGEAVVLTQNFATQEGSEATAVHWTGEW